MCAPYPISRLAGWEPNHRLNQVSDSLDQMTQDEGDQHEQSEGTKAKILLVDQGSKGRPLHHEQQSNDGTWSDDANNLVSVERPSYIMCLISQAGFSGMAAGASRAR